MPLRQAWEKNWLLDHGWTLAQINLLEQSNDRTPVEYLTQTALFAKLKIKVNAQTLIPRPETEKLVDLAFDWYQQTYHHKKIKGEQSTYQFLDIGTGSGAISLALTWRLLKYQYLNFKILATDISAQALTIAQANIQAYHYQRLIHLRQSDLLTQLQTILASQNTPYALIANLPYIPYLDLVNLAPEVKNHEPLLALDGGVQGLSLLKKLLAQIKSLAYPPEAIILEIDPSQTHFFTQPPYQWQILADFNHLPRYALGHLN